MKLVNSLFENLENQTAEDIRSAVNQRIFDIGFEGVGVGEVSVDIDGETVVTFVDDDLDEMDVLFAYDPEDGAEAIILDDSDTDDDELEIDMLDLDALKPRLIDFGNENIAIDLVNNKWMNKSFFETLFSVGDFMEEEEKNIDERSAFVVRDGKKVKVALVRRKRKKRLTSKQKAGIKKGVRKRKSKKGQIARKRKKSLKLRGRLKLKKKDNKKFKAGS